METQKIFSQQPQSQYCLNTQEKQQYLSAVSPRTHPLKAGLERVPEIKETVKDTSIDKSKSKVVLVKDSKIGMGLNQVSTSFIEDHKNW
jgi:hypothetical protein